METQRKKTFIVGLGTKLFFSDILVITSLVARLLEGHGESEGNVLLGTTIVNLDFTRGWRLQQFVALHVIASVDVFQTTWKKEKNKEASWLKKWRYDLFVYGDIKKTYRRIRGPNRVRWTSKIRQWRHKRPQYRLTRHSESECIYMSSTFYIVLHNGGWVCTRWRHTERDLGGMYMTNPSWFTTARASPTFFSSLASRLQSNVFRRLCCLMSTKGYTKMGMQFVSYT